ncbi:hypothetical protein HN681_02640 [archaeon]|jgi:hypothetical protein|nr:hypothetical protein [archaeon]MBT3731185.1 hypothetical protein [archaeon]MBT4670061.1 hypothetical protein [archaeon]MBT7052548.1 hypothetical protein [archaeon]MBT8010316.1 hypothetical protein [archaeon]
MKKGVIISFILIIFLFSIVSAAFTIDDSGDLQERDSQEAEGETYPTYEPEDVVEEVEGATYDDEGYNFEEVTDEEFETNFEADDTITTSQGSMADFSMTNALFSLGSLVQGSFVSFENNNNLFINSVFDASQFTATLNEEGEIAVAQKNGFGSTGQVYITLENGNLTQDEAIIFVPEGDSPTYIYYNSTEIEFEDGSIYLLGESVTNNDNTDGSTTVEFDENGFTRLELHAENVYTNFDYSIINQGSESLIICKEDSLCDINIEDGSFTINGEVDFLYQNESFYLSKDPNNVFSYDSGSLEVKLSNAKIRNGVLAYVYTGNHLITEGKEDVYDKPINEAKADLVRTYISDVNDKEILINNNGVLSYQNFVAYDDDEILENEITGAVVGTSSDGNVLGWLFIVLGSFVVFLLISEYKINLRKRGQFSIFAVLGIVLFIIIVLVFFVSQGSSEVETNLASIESLEQAREAVEVCVEEYVVDSVFLQGEYSGFFEEGESSFGLSYDLLSKEEIEENLDSYLESNLGDCVDILEDSGFILDGDRVNVELSFSNTINVEVDSLGKVYREESNYENVRNLEIEVEVDFDEMYSIIEGIYNSEYGNPVESYENYLINTYVDRSYEEQLILVYDLEEEYEFKISKKLNL